MSAGHGTETGMAGGAAAPRIYSTLLAAMWAEGGDEEVILAALERGELVLTGTFRGREAELAEGARAA